MNKETALVGIAVAMFISLLLLARQDPLSDRAIGAKWCAQRYQLLDEALPGKTKRPPYHDGEYRPQTKLTITCKKKVLH